MIKDIIKGFFTTEEEKYFKKLRIELIKESSLIAKESWNIKFEDIEKTNCAQEILIKGEGFCKHFLIYCCANLEDAFDGYPDNYIKMVAFFLSRPNFIWSCDEIMYIIKTSKYFLTSLNRLSFPNMFFIDFFDIYLTKNEINDDIKKALNLLKYSSPYTKEEKIVNEKINTLMEMGKSFKLSNKEFISKALNDFLLSCPSESRENWIIFFKKCRYEGMKSSTTKKWLNETANFIKEEIKIEEFSRIMQLFLQQGIDYLKEKHKEEAEHNLYVEINETQHFVLKAMIWNCGISGEKILHQLLFDFATWAFKKYPTYGPLAKMTGNAVLVAFANLPIQEGIPRLMALQSKVNNKSITASIEKKIKESAKNNKISFDNIEEISIPNYGMEEVGILKMTFGTIASKTIFKPNGKNETSWENNGKNQASVPAIVKTDFAKELKQLKSTIKEIEQLLPSQRNRIENQYLMPVSWSFKDWFLLYISHPVIGILGQRLIWHFNDNGIKSEGIFNKNHFENALGEPLVIDDTTTVQLWHPIGFDAGYVQEWRNYLINNEIQQPFKQAFREVYIITDAELNTVNYSNRFAAHILRQHQFATLAKLRAWNYTLQGNWDSHNTPYKTLKNWNITAQYYVDAIDAETSQAGIFNFVSTDQVRFYRGAVQLDMQEVPAMVFTEIMRDIDMYVGVCSIGNDPNWQNNPNGQHQNYWHSYSFGELTENAKVRAETLKIIVPKLKIASKCSFENNYLLVKGKIRTYKIHLGSGNILMTPNDQYLCIVPDSSKKVTNDKIFLPFDGDSMLSIILSKAFLLADDDKITDSTIVRQIRNK